MAAQSLNTPYFFLAGTSIVAIVAVFTILQPQLASIQETQAQISSIEDTLHERQQFLRSLDNKLAELELNRIHESRLQVMLPYEESMEDAIRILHQAAASSGLEIVDVHNRSDAEAAIVRMQQSRGEIVALPNNVRPLGLHVDFNTRYQSLRSFLASLERMPRVMDVHSISLRGNDTEPDLLNGSVLVRFYMLDQK